MLAGFEIAMNDPLLVRRLQRLGNLLRDWQRFIERNRPACDPVGEVFALDEFHHEGIDAVGVLQPVDGRDVRMVQRGEDFRFALESGKALGIRREGLRQNLQSDVAFQSGIPRPIDFTHAADADLGGDLVDAKAGAGGKGQEGSPWIIRAAWRPGRDYS